MGDGEHDNRRAHVCISGSVQGVFFRDSTRQKARALGLAGWVRNLPDGRVEALFEGPPERVTEMVGWCKKGPSHAEVESVDIDSEAARGDLQGFEIR